ncbi:MAG: nickel-dependent hydrogenase large subunit [Elusimicrobiota bacterium]
MAQVTIPLGPQHPALKEPGNFLLTLEGEKVVGAKVRVGYNHRGIEKACEARTYLQDIYLIERICGICSHAHTTCFCMAVEELAKAEVPKRAQAIRVLVGELERLHSHLLWLGVAGHEIGFDTLFMYVWKDREHVMDCLELVGGNRVNYAINTIGGVRRDIAPEMKTELLKRLDILEERTKYYVEVGTQEPTLLARCAGVGMLPKDVAIRLGAVGPTLRASGVDMDVRRDDPHLLYGELDFKVITSDRCDVLGRVIVRVLEVLESVKICREVLNNLPEGPIAVKVPRRIPPGEVVTRYEAPRGEDIHYVRSNGTEKPDRVKVRAPTLANWASMAHMLEGGRLADVPITIAAIDPCFSCTDRATIVRDGVWGTLDLHSLRRRS